MSANHVGVCSQSTSQQSTRRAPSSVSPTRRHAPTSSGGTLTDAVGSAIPAQDADRRRVEVVARVVELRTVGDEHERVDRRRELDVLPRRADALLEGELPLGGDGDVGEEVDVVREIAHGHPVLRGEAEEDVAAAVLVAGVRAVAHDVGLLRAGAAHRVVASAGVGDDHHQLVAVDGQQPRAGREVGLALRASPSRCCCSDCERRRRQ